MTGHRTQMYELSMIMYFSTSAILFLVPKRDVVPGARFSKDRGTFRARKVIFSPSVYENGELYAPETSCMKGTSVHIKRNM